MWHKHTHQVNKLYSKFHYEIWFNQKWKLWFFLQEKKKRRRSIWKTVKKIMHHQMKLVSLSNMRESKERGIIQSPLPLPTLETQMYQINEYRPWTSLDNKIPHPTPKIFWILHAHIIPWYKFCIYMFSAMLTLTILVSMGSSD